MDLFRKSCAHSVDLLKSPDESTLALLSSPTAMYLNGSRDRQQHHEEFSCCLRSAISVQASLFVPICVCSIVMLRGSSKSAACYTVSTESTYQGEHVFLIKEIYHSSAHGQIFNESPIL